MLIAPQKENKHLTVKHVSKVHMCALNRVTQWPYAKPVLDNKYVLNKAWVWYILSVHFRSNPLKIFPISSTVPLVLNLRAYSKVHDGESKLNLHKQGLCSSDQGFIYVKRGQKLTVIKLGEVSLVLLSHLIQCSQVPRGRDSGKGGGGLMSPFAPHMKPC